MAPQQGVVIAGKKCVLKFFGLKGRFCQPRPQAWDWRPMGISP
jgi:hypothetical protein